MDNIKILLKKSNQLDQQTGAPKEPSESELSYGEIAINYHDGGEKIFIKNDNYEIVSFATEEQIDTKLANKIEGQGIKHIISLTKSEYDELANKDSETIYVAETPAPAYLPGDFSVSANKTIKFANGNLQAVIGTGISDYRATASSWKFAEHQYDYIGNAAGNTTFATGSTVDTFGWVGASASYDSYGLCTNVTNNAYYGTSASETLKTDWGSIPDVVSSYGTGWRTLTVAEWNYLFTERTNASSLYGHCQITTASDTVAGMLILPDNWTKPSNCTVTPGTGAFDRVTYSATAASGTSNAWVDMEAAGAVFLPAAGYRNGLYMNNVGISGYYRSSSVKDVSIAYSVLFYSGALNQQFDNNFRYAGSSVRLVYEGAEINHGINLYKGSELIIDASEKQDTLVSGTNIKTINNESILGIGNINVSGLPSVSSTDNGKILKVVDGQWTLVDPVTVYTGTDEPSSLLGEDGDIYLQTE